jgi:sodium-dependent dicarboxylate transporter 2/3/5
MLLQVVLLVTQRWTLEKWITNSAGVSLLSESGATPSIFCGILLFLLPSKVRPGESLLTWKAAHENVPWGVLLLIGGGFALSEGFVQSGLDNAAGSALSDAMSSCPPLLLTFLVVWVTTLVTQICSNIAAVNLMLPILSSASLLSVMNPLQVMVPAAVACSFAFVLPTATPANAVVLAKSRDLAEPLRFHNFLKAGLPLTLVASVAGALLSHVLARAVFDADAPFPQFACGASNCAWLAVPGEVSGRWVNEQACILIDEYNDAECKLWNGTLVNMTVMAVTGVPLLDF